MYGLFVWPCFVTNKPKRCESKRLKKTCRYSYCNKTVGIYEAANNRHSFFQIRAQISIFCHVLAKTKIDYTLNVPQSDGSLIQEIEFMNDSCLCFRSFEVVISLISEFINVTLNLFNKNWCQIWFLNNWSAFSEVRHCCRKKWPNINGYILNSANTETQQVPNLLASLVNFTNEMRGFKTDNERVGSFERSVTSFLDASCILHKNQRNRSQGGMTHIFSGKHLVCMH